MLSLKMRNKFYKNKQTTKSRIRQIPKKILNTNSLFFLLTIFRESPLRMRGVTSSTYKSFNKENNSLFTLHRALLSYEIDGDQPLPPGRQMEHPPPIGLRIVQHLHPVTFSEGYVRICTRCVRA